MPDQYFGIDLGTTHSAIAWVDESGRPAIIPNIEGGNTTPSIVYIGPAGPVVGDAARIEMAFDPDSAARFFKRDMGTAAGYTYQGSRWTPVMLSAEVLKKLKADAEVQLGCAVERCVITVPAYFQDAGRVATVEAGRMAGLEVIQVLNEPTAAALAYGLHGLTETVLVYDLGGGTFDISLVRVSPEGIQVIGTGGNHHLGGKDWDDRLAQHVCAEFFRLHGVDPLDDPTSFQDVLTRCEEAKKVLSQSSRAAVPVNCDGKMARIAVTRDLFETITRDLLSQTETLVDRVLEETGFPRPELSGVLLAGGSTLMPACRDLAARIFGKPPVTSVNPHECVALGAAIQAAFGTAASPHRLGFHVRDVIGHSLGMIAISGEGDRYVNSILIARNKPVPSRETRPYLVQIAPGERTLPIYVTQGESENPADCAFVARFVIHEIPAAGSLPRILDISYEYDISGVVSVSASLRGSPVSLPVVKEADLGDLSWILEPPRKAETPAQKTIYLAVDLSGSMAGAPLENAQKAMCSFLWNLDLAHGLVGLISFADQVRVDAEACRNAPLLEQRVKAWRAGSVGFGNQADPFEAALGVLRGGEGERYLVVLTDGVWSDQEKAIKRAAKCREAGIHIVTIGFGSADESFLKRIASADESALFVTTGDLRPAFGQVAQVLLETSGGVAASVRHGAGA